MKLLFICTHNRCRSILAEAISNHLSNGRIIAASAGSAPAGEVHPLSLQFLNEHSINTTGLKSQSWHEFESFKPDAVLTMCDSAAAETCPVWFGQSVQVHWGLADPSKISGTQQQLRDSFNSTINLIERRIQALLESTSDLDTLDNKGRRIILSDIAKEIN